jgi:hypothetical protein
MKSDVTYMSKAKIKLQLTHLQKVCRHSRITTPSPGSIVEKQMGHSNALVFSISGTNSVAISSLYPASNAFNHTNTTTDLIETQELLQKQNMQQFLSVYLLKNRNTDMNSK